MTNQIPLGSGVVGNLEPVEERPGETSWISPFAVPQSAEVGTVGPGLVQFIRFQYLGGESAGNGPQAETMDGRTDPAVDLFFTGPLDTVKVVACNPPADVAALERIADRLTARAEQEKRIARRFSLIMIARILKVWAGRFAGLR